jgi:hypothetical protein|tara:strand:- start:162 stop:404 length:243 start_codon:yes stop_codon:yes gene_type:complete
MPNKFNETTEDGVTSYGKVVSVVLIPDLNKMIYNTEKVLVLSSGQEIVEGTETLSSEIDETSDLYVSIMEALPSSESSPE